MGTQSSVIGQVPQAEGWLRHFRDAGRREDVSPALLLAIASRESALGQTLDPMWKGDGGNAWGIMQIDRRAHPVWTATHDPRNHRANIMKGANVLRKELDYFGELRPALASYNASRGSVEDAMARGISVDTATTGGDYTDDVLQRYEWIKAARPDLAEAGAGQRLAMPHVALAGLAAGGAYALYRTNQRDT